MADEIILFDTGSNDETVELAQEVDCFVHHCDDVSAPSTPLRRIAKHRRSGRYNDVFTDHRELETFPIAAKF